VKSRVGMSTPPIAENNINGPQPSRQQSETTPRSTISKALNVRLAGAAASTSATARLPRNRMRVRIHPTPNRLPWRAQKLGKAPKPLLDDSKANRDAVGPDARLSTGKSCSLSQIPLGTATAFSRRRPRKNHATPTTEFPRIPSLVPRS